MGVAGWENTSAAVEEDWLATSAGRKDGGWAPDPSTAGVDELLGEDNVSKHAGGEYAPGSHDGGCRICHEDGHFARDCPNKPPNDGACFNCGEQGHSKADCPNPRIDRPFDGTCRLCNEAGHRAAECPGRACMICGQPGHTKTECTANRLFGANGAAELTPEDAWHVLEAADKAKDLDDVKTAIFTYAKSYPELQLAELESAFRESEMNTHLIAKEQAVSDTHTIVNFQGKIDQKYVVSFQLDSKPKRAKFAEGWPKTSEENLQRLAEAGFVLDRMVDKCFRCGELGHRSSKCTQERTDREDIVVISCTNCGQEGHRIRDCPEERKKRGKKACKNCGAEDHIAKECPEPPNPDNVECHNCGNVGHFSRDCPDREPETCRNCGEEGHRSKECDKERVMICRNCDGRGHISKECPEPRNMAKVQCRNCDEYGHTSRDCKQPTDWSRVECSNCHEKGHSYKRCTKPPAEDASGDAGWGDGAGIGSGTGGVTSNGGGGSSWDDGKQAVSTDVGGDGW